MNNLAGNQLTERSMEETVFKSIDQTVWIDEVNVITRQTMLMHRSIKYLIIIIDYDLPVKHDCILNQRCTPLR